MLTHAQARRFYDRYGSRQDKSSWYEDPPIAVMLAHSAMARAQSVLEFGCGTGRIAAHLLQHELAPEARYMGIDASSTMAGLAAGRLQPYRARATVCLTGGPLQLPVAGGCCDRFLSTYVLDLLSPDDIYRVLQEAQRVLRPRGLLCLVSLTHGATPVARGVERLWTAVYRRNPARLGGCRPITLLDSLDASAWRIHHHDRVTCYGLTSETLVAVKW